MSYDRSHRLQKETEAARVLRAHLDALDISDEEVIRDTIEGETSLHELIEKVVEDIHTDTASLEGIDVYLDKLKGRKERLKARIESRRSAILNAMAMGELKSMQVPLAALSRVPTQPKVVVTDEDKIPSTFFKRGDPKLDKVALKAALTAEDAKPVPGANMSNGGETLNLRWS